jgi:Tfp pilus assembly protein PilX
MNRPYKRTPSTAEPQKGLALLVALIVLVAMSLAGIALVRSVDTASLLAGNIAFRQGATLGADAGIEAARSYLMTALAGSLENNQLDAGYYATSQDAVDLTGNRSPGNDGDDVKWPGVTGGISTPVCIAVKDDAGNSICYIVHRLCDSIGAVDVTTCATEQGTASDRGSSKGGYLGGMTYTGGLDPDPLGPPMVYYRVTVRVAGPRNNVSYVQSFLLI